MASKIVHLSSHDYSKPCEWEEGGSPELGFGWISTRWPKCRATLVWELRRTVARTKSPATLKQNGYGTPSRQLSSPIVVTIASANCRRQLLSLLLSPLVANFRRQLSSPLLSPTVVANCCHHCYRQLSSPTVVTTAIANYRRQLFSPLLSPTVGNTRGNCRWQL